MKFENGTLVVTEDSLKLVEQASATAPNITIASVYLYTAVGKNTLTESIESNEMKFYRDVIKAYREKNFRIE